MMKDTEALDILRAQGYAVGTPDVHTGRVRVWIRGSDEAVDVAPPTAIVRLFPLKCAGESFDNTS